MNQLDRDIVLDVATTAGVTPAEVERAIALIRTGRAELVAAVIAKKISIDQALRLARQQRIHRR
jgi:hypothetical protein